MPCELFKWLRLDRVIKLYQHNKRLPYKRTKNRILCNFNIHTGCPIPGKNRNQRNQYADGMMIRDLELEIVKLISHSNRVR